ncbi:MAG: hypothetical protein AAGD28_23210 [Bacteroidota bacterium]
MKFQLLIFLLPLCLACSQQKETKAPLEDSPISQQEITEARYDQHRVFFDTKGTNGESVSFYTDTGGGKLIYPEAAEKLGLAIDTMEQGEQTAEMINLMDLFTERNHPAPIGPHFVYRGERRGSTYDGMLGAHWFAEKIWNFDYQKEKLYLVEEVDWSSLDKAHTVELGFMSNMMGQHATHFPRIPIQVDGKIIQTLFDTGANAPLSDSAKASFGGADEAATSFIIATIFDQWRADHPDWPYLEGADLNLHEAMIQVPEMEIAGHTVGPVWFTRRADKNFSEFMSQWMDEPIEGAIGGSCFKYFSQLIIDYPEEKAYFGL